MIAKAATISHGGNAVRYSVNKDKAEIVKVNFLPDDISAEAMFQRMVLKQKEFSSIINKGRPLKRNVIRMEISPTKEESSGWTLDDWVRLANEYIHASVSYLQSAFLVNILRLYPSTPFIDDVRSRHCPFRYQVVIIDLSIHVHTVYIYV